MEVLYHIVLEEYDEKNNGPLLIEDRWGQQLGWLKPTHKNDKDLLRMIHNTYEEGMKRGRKQKAEEVRKALGL